MKKFLIACLASLSLSAWALEMPDASQNYQTLNRNIPSGIEFVSLDGKPFALKKLEGKVTVLHLWATWCGPCIYEIPEIARLQKQLKGSRVQIVGVAVGQTPQTVNRFLARRGQKDFFTLADPARQTGRIMPLNIVPINYVINASGRLIGVIPGAVNWSSEATEELLRSLAKEKNADSVLRTAL